MSNILVSQPPAGIAVPKLALVASQLPQKHVAPPLFNFYGPI